MVRAESLFRKFQRMVEAIDKKSNFPIPTVRQRLPQPPSPSTTQPGSDGRPRQSSQSSTQQTNAAGNTSGRDKSIADYIAEGIEAEKERVITSELRILLSREVPKLDKTEVREHGGGIGS